MEKISITKIIFNAFVIPWNNLLFYSQVLTIPVLVLVTVWAVWSIISPTSHLFGYFFYFIHFLAFAYLAITCHKLILTENKSIKEILSLDIKQLTRFFFLALIVYMMSFIVKFIIITVYINIFSTHTANGIRFELAEYIAYLPSMYIIGRFCIIFPAIALGYKPSFKWSWRATRHNHLQILFIVAIFPWLLQIIISALYRGNATLMEQSLIALLTYLSTIIGVFAISLTYRELYNIEQKNL